MKNVRSLAKVAAAALAAFVLGGTQAAEGPPTSNGVISSPTLVANQQIAKAQAVNAITLFMSKGTQECDKDGKNCKSLFGADDSMDYNSVQLNTSSLTGIQSYSFASGNTADERMDSNTIATQMGTAVLACGNTSPQTVAGVAVKLTSCAVTAAGDAQITFQVCSAPSRGNPVTPPEKVMKCSDDPASSTFYPKPGYSCAKPACDTEPRDSLNGWSSPSTISYQQSVALNGSDDEKSKNGLGLVFYPALTGGTPSFDSDSDSMTAVKIVQTAINTATRSTAVGLRIAFRHKTKVTKDMMVEGTASVPDPKKNTAAWETIEKLQGNALIPQYQATYAANGSECMQKIQNGLSTDGVVSVCDQQYTNESGVKPIALTAQVGAEGQNCGTTAQCLTEVVNTNTWTQTCSADVPLSIRKCTTKQDYDMAKLSYVRTRTAEVCTEERLNAVYSCQTYGELDRCTKESIVNQGGVDMGVGQADTSIVLVGQNDITAQYRLGTVGDNYWGTGYYSREFVIDIRDKDAVKIFRLYHAAYDDETAISINGNWIWSDFPGATYHPEQNRWGYYYDYCLSSGDGECTQVTQLFRSFWERGTSWERSLNIDFIPYLKEGRNVIRVDTGVVGGGESWLFFDISAWKLSCQTRVTNECQRYESAR